MQSPLKPPKYLDSNDLPHREGIVVQKPPLCKPCDDKAASHQMLEKQVQAMGGARPQSFPVTPERPKPLASVSSFDPVATELTSPTTDSLKTLPNDGRRPVPAWMKLLPSNVNSDIHPPHHSVLQRRLSFPFVEHTRYSSPFSTPPEFPRSQDLQVEELARALKTVPESAPRKRDGLTLVNTVSGSLTYWRSSPHPSRQNSWRRYNMDNTVGSTTLRQKLATSYPASLPLTPPMTPTQGVETPSIPLIEKQDIGKAQKQSASLRRRLSKSIKPSSILAKCEQPQHSRNVRDSISHAKPPFFSELSGFFATRTGK